MAKGYGASVKKLSTLHELLTDLFIQDIQFCIDEKIPMSASDKGVIVTFLKNEEITGNPSEEQLDELRESFSEFQDEARRNKAMSIVNQAQDDIPMS